MAMNLNLNELTVENIGSWPVSVKVALVSVVCVAILGLGYFYDTKKQVQHKSNLVKTEVHLRKDFETKQHLAVNLQKYHIQIIKMRRTFGDMLRQLPSKTDVPGLLEDISKTGVASGLEFKLFDPVHEIQHEFYAELPINISVVGNYHQLGEFVSNVAALDRIVTLHNLIIVERKNEKQRRNAKKPVINFDDRLLMNITAKTYRYTEENENNGINNNGNPKG